MDLQTPTNTTTPESLQPKLERAFELAAQKCHDIAESWDPAKGTPVFTVNGRYTTRGWTEWTRGFQYGSMLLAFDATDDRTLADRAAQLIHQHIPHHITHTGVHDHGFNILSTFGNLRRLTIEGRLLQSEDTLRYHNLAIKASGAVQAMRWTPILDHTNQRNTGYIHSFNGPHSLFADTMRSLRSLALAHQLGHTLLTENDQSVNLLERAIHHALTTARYTVYYGEGRDAYDTPHEAGRTTHESLFNTTDGRYRCPSTQQGYSPFSTWTRGLAWVLLGFAEQLEYLATPSAYDLDNWPQPTPDQPATKAAVQATYLRAAIATADWYINHSFADGMVYWDAGAPNIPPDTDYSQPSNPHNNHEPIDSSVAAIAAQGFLRLSNILQSSDPTTAQRYHAAALRIAQTLFDEPYLSTDPNHQGLILHAIYHRPNGWDHTPPNQSIPCNESALWGDYHALELALLLHRQHNKLPYITFFDQ